MMDKKALRISLIVGGAFLMENLDSTAISTAIPKMASSFKVTPVMMSAGITWYVIMLAVFIPISGWFSDVFGTKKVFTTAIIGFILSSIGCGLSQNLTHFITARVCQGIAGAMMVPVGRLAVLSSTAKKDLVTAIAYITWPGLIGPVIGPLVGGFFTTYYSWHYIFFINVPLGIIAIICTLKYIPNLHTGVRRKLDVLGFLLSVTSLTSFMYGLQAISETHSDYGKPIAYILGAMIVMVLFVLHCKRSANPLIDFSVLKVRTYAITVYSGTLTRMVINMPPLLIPLMFQIGFHLTPLQSGWLFTASMVGNLAIKPATVWVTRKFDFRKVLIVNGLLLALVTWAQSMMSPMIGYVLIILIMLFSGMIRSMQFSSLNTLAYADIPQARMSNANTLYSTIQQMSIGMGIALGSICLHFASMIHKSNDKYSLSDFKLALEIVAVFCVISIIEFFRLKSTDGLSVRGIIPKEA